MASEEAEAIGKRLERAFAFDDWAAFWAHAKQLYEQGVRDGGGGVVESFAEEAPAAPVKVAKAKAKAPAAAKCPACGGAGERTVSLPRDPNSPVLEPRSVLGPCPDCGGSGGGVPVQFTGEKETVVQPEAKVEGVTVKPLPPVVSGGGGRFVLVGPCVVDKEERKVVYQGADAGAVYEALGGV